MHFYGECGRGDGERYPLVSGLMICNVYHFLTEKGCEICQPLRLGPSDAALSDTSKVNKTKYYTWVLGCLGDSISYFGFAAESLL